MKPFLSFALAFFSVATFAANSNAPAPPPDLKSPPAGADVASDGLVTKQLALGGGGEKPGANDSVHLRYTVWKTSDGSVVDYTRTTTPAFVPLSKLFLGMREMIQFMTPGEKRRA